MRSWGAIFDWDGVIIDSSGYHERSWAILADEEGLSLPEGHFKRSFGMRNETAIPHVLGWTSDPREISRLADRKEEIYRELIAERGILPLPGVTEWLAALRGAGVPCAVASSTPRLNIEVVLERIGLEDRFSAILAAEDVERGKPDPQVFLLAAQRIAVPPRRCVVFEDAHVGIEAARAAGMKVVGVSTTHRAQSLRGADRVVQRLDELTVQEVAGWF